MPVKPVCVLVTFEDGSTWTGSWKQLGDHLVQHLQLYVPDAVSDSLSDTATAMHGKSLGDVAPAAPTPQVEPG